MRTNLRALKIHSNVYLTYRRWYFKWRNKRSLSHIFSSSKLEKGNINVRIFRLVLYSVPELNPQQINLDFEASAILVILEVFSHAEINGCYLKIFKKCFGGISNVLDLLTTRKNKHIWHSIKMCAFLALLDPGDVGEEFVLIQAYMLLFCTVSLLFYVNSWCITIRR